MKALSLFSGIGGLDLGAERAGIKTAAFCEKEPFCREVLRKNWPDTPIFDDVFNLRGDDIVEAIDVIHGGFPCQPFSLAGYRNGFSDERYLWPEFSRLIGEIKPRWVVAENVPGIIGIAADEVCADLESQGYSVRIFDFEAAAVGAIFRRRRIFFVAHTDSQRCGGRGSESNQGRVQFQEEAVESWSEVSGRCVQYLQNPETAPEHIRSNYGLPDWMDRVRALGNAVVPRQAEVIFKSIVKSDSIVKSKGGSYYES